MSDHSVVNAAHSSCSVTGVALLAVGGVRLPMLSSSENLTQERGSISSYSGRMAWGFACSIKEPWTILEKPHFSTMNCSSGTSS